MKERDMRDTRVRYKRDAIARYKGEMREQDTIASEMRERDTRASKYPRERDARASYKSEKQERETRARCKSEM
jgi:hypothetical protein